MSRFGLLAVALLVVLGGALGWAVVVMPGLATSPTGEPTTPAASDSTVVPAAPAVSAPPLAPVPSLAPTPPTVPTVDAALSNQPAVAAAPTRLSVASLGVDVPVVGVGLDGGGSMALPPDPAVAGWYHYGPAPASPAGATVIAAHVDSLVYGLGPFAALADSTPGTEIVVTDAAGLARTYVVSTVDTTGKGDVVWSSVFDRGGAPRLVVVTCGGEFDYSTRHYLSNVIVVATPVG